MSAVAKVADPTLASTWFIDADDAKVRAFAAKAVEGVEGEKARALALYYAVRDQIRYDPYKVDYSKPGFRASRCLETGNGFCITKAALLAAVARAEGIPARLGFADVRNHLTTDRMKEQMKTDLFVFHGFTELFLDGKWVKATPAFNLALCEKVGVKPLEFDGETDSIFHPFDNSGRKHMEYVRERGTYDDLPYDEIMTTFTEVYGPMVTTISGDGDFAAEAKAG
ncbi:transglutaminase-like domain-containing protein [Zavarzinia sp. CC-PAN008]|uniref:transglutaminase-like domain-containing protein n=1 Tax=Zavarzinia sp. CC-PAN008 TaxID=3243332 RepID=UPI003F74945A